MNKGGGPGYCYDRRCAMSIWKHSLCLGIDTEHGRKLQEDRQSQMQTRSCGCFRLNPTKLCHASRTLRALYRDMQNFSVGLKRLA